MASILFWRDVSPSGTPGFDEVNSFFYDTVTTFISSTSNDIPTGVSGEFHPPVGSILLQQCEGLDLKQYKSSGSVSNVVVDTIVNSPTCCTLQVYDFNVVKTNNTSLLTPNGTIVVTAVILDIGDYEASIDSGANWVTQAGGAITFEDLPAGNYSIIIRAIAGVCSVTTSTVIADQITYPPLIISENTQPDLYSPVFHPITLGFLLDNNTGSIKEDMNGTYIEVLSQDGKDYLATLPIIKIINNEDYEGTYQVTEVDDPGNPQKFYIDATYTTDQSVLFVPFDRQVFQLYAEKSFNNFQRIADITVYPNSETGEYFLRLEGFLQAVFAVMAPVNNGDEITLLRKYYVVPRDFDMESTPTVYNAVFSAVTPLTSFLGDLIPLGPAPINFINEQTQKGYPVLFSYIDLTVGRVKNITSSDQTNIINTGTEVFINALPLNQYDFSWINPAGAISSLNVSPALPSWITLLASASDTVALHIDTGGTVEGGDYDGSDYDGDDYLTGGPNAIVGCYVFEFTDGGVTPLFTLTICVFPIQTSNGLCVSDPLNIAWINREGGWSSYVFEGKRTLGKEIGDTKTYKSGLELKKSSVENVYNTMEVSIFNKSIKDLQFIASLRQSIQAYLYDPATLQWSIPITLDKESFPVYSKPFKQIEVADKFKFKYSEEVLIQTQ